MLTVDLFQFLSKDRGIVARICVVGVRAALMQGEVDKRADGLAVTQANDHADLGIDGAGHLAVWLTGVPGDDRAVLEHVVAVEAVQLVPAEGHLDRLATA